MAVSSCFTSGTIHDLKKKKKKLEIYPSLLWSFFFQRPSSFWLICLLNSHLHPFDLDCLLFPLDPQYLETLDHQPDPLGQDCPCHPTNRPEIRPHQASKTNTQIHFIHFILPFLRLGRPYQEAPQLQQYPE